MPKKTNIMKIVKTAVSIILILIILIILFFVGLFVYHRVCIEKEKPLTESPIGEMIEVNGKKMCVYTCGSGEKTLVFMSGFGTPSPVLNFKSLYSLLSDDYSIAVVEKFGYGFSDDTDGDRGVSAMLSETRSALDGAGVKAPYVLCPHSFSGTEAICWAQTYPDEVEAIIYLDAIVPGIYDITPLDPALEYTAKFASDSGLIRLIPDNDLSPAAACGTLTDEEKQIYLAIARSHFRTKAMMNEVSAASQSLELVASGEVPEVPMLFFISDMGITEEEPLQKYRQLAREYTSDKAEYIYFDCGHEVHNFEYIKIAEEIKRFLG